ncbi:MAG: arylsulfatase [Akkermansiaceae bacterium]|nr:arylsulfatase [Akkermansiaceae bacterium]
MRILGLVLLAGMAAAAAAPPNVLIVMTDDQGYPELSAHGNPVVRTPHLDKLHAESVRLADFHVAPMCTPTRGQLLTGIDAARNGAINVSSGRTLLKEGYKTLADHFGGAGYRTGLFGKWHLGDNYPSRPFDRGFEDTLWFPSSHINSVPDHWNNDYFDDTYRRNERLEKCEGYCTDVFFTEAIAWMRSRAEAGERFFCYLPTNAPHGPFWVPQAYRDRVAARFDAVAESLPEAARKRRRDLITYLAMIENIDANFGRLETFLTESGLRENTMVIFLTDNGSTFGHIYFPCGMRGRKTQLWEGGHRVPCLIRWPKGGLQGGRDVEGLTQVQDLCPTLLSLCGVPADTAFDGADLAPVLRGESAIPGDRMLVINYSRMPGAHSYPVPDSPSRMRREGAGVLWKRWRLLEDRELYDLETDPMQERNVIDKHPEVAKTMRARLDQWWKEVRDVANVPQPTVIGDRRENPMMLTACEWLDVFVDQQGQVRRGSQKNGWWELRVAEAGEYEFELRRWPREADLAIGAASPQTIAADGVFPEGRAIPIASARMQVGSGIPMRKPVRPDSKQVTFTARLPAGKTRLYTWFEEARDRPLLGAYYVYVNRTGESGSPGR